MFENDNFLKSIHSFTHFHKQGNNLHQLIFARQHIIITLTGGIGTIVHSCILFETYQRP